MTIGATTIVMGRKLVTVGLVTALLTGCAADGGSKQNAGAVTGAVLGGLLGSQLGGHGKGQLAATALGVFVGAVAGSEIGRSLDRADQLALERNTQISYTAPLKQPIVWDNPDNGNRVVVTPTREGRTPAGAYCREFQQTITVGGKTQNAYGQACQQPDGSWKIVS